MLDKIVEAVGFIMALSIASERLVEIIKGFIPFLVEEIKNDQKMEGKRRSLLQILAVFSGIITSFLSKDILPADMNHLSILVLGLLASGGSGFWNAILEYILGVKNLKKQQAENDRTSINSPHAN